MSERKSPLILIDNKNRWVAEMISQGFDFPWTFGKLKALDQYAEYSDIFDKAKELKELEEKAADEGNSELEDLYADKLRDLLDEITDMGFKIIRKDKNEAIEYSQLNIIGLTWEYK